MNESCFFSKIFYNLKKRGGVTVKEKDITEITIILFALFLGALGCIFWAIVR